VKPENKFKKKILKNLSCSYTPIEMYLKMGVPDIYGFYSTGSTFWLEFKCTKMKKVLISPLQIAWNYKHFCNSPRNFYIVESLEARCFKLYEGNRGKELLKEGFSLEPCLMRLEYSKKDFLKLDNFLKFL
tara:strand:+ start:674 stop:1063 length:390 start_codon:yes stop_codon:yes gene_type:complete